MTTLHPPPSLFLLFQKKINNTILIYYQIEENSLKNITLTSIYQVKCSGLIIHHQIKSTPQAIRKRYNRGDNSMLEKKRTIFLPSFPHYSVYQVDIARFAIISYCMFQDLTIYSSFNDIMKTRKELLMGTHRKENENSSTNETIKHLVTKFKCPCYT